MSSAIVLLGYMGCGKTKVGKKLSKKIGAKFFDLDAEIELYQSKPISQIFDEIGEIGFRKIERKVLIKLLNKNDFFVLFSPTTVKKPSRFTLVGTKISLFRTRGPRNHGLAKC